MKPRERERERERHLLTREDDVISDGGGCSTPPPPPLPPALQPPTDVMCKVFSQLDCDDLLSCSLVCKQWYRDSSELREGWKKDYMGAASFYRVGFLHNAVKMFYPTVKFYPRFKNKGISRFSKFL